MRKPIYAILALALLLAACSTAPTPIPTATPHVCYGRAGIQYSQLTSSQRPITYQGLVVGWISFQNGVITKAVGMGIGGPVNPTPMQEGFEYTVDLNFMVNSNSLATLELVGFVCGNTFYYTVPQQGPLFVG